jgi:ABC-type phosphate/phosphonate transport system substrate-binding protein
MNAEGIAALPMYDFPDLVWAHDAWWAAVAARLQAAGVTRVPTRLSRNLDHVATWRDRRLLLGQACEYPLAKSTGVDFRLVATPRYAAPGCEGARYRSAIVVRRTDLARSVADLRGRRAVVNEPDSNSGMNLFRAAIAPIAGGIVFFESVTVSGSHWNSARLIADDGADVAAIDCVTYRHLQRADPATMGTLRILDWTPASPSLPYVTAKTTEHAIVDALRAALADAVLDPSLARVRDSLLLTGFDFDTDAGFGAVLALERGAVELGYAVLR